jgi:pilus assembly protein Flp/PilA
MENLRFFCYDIIIYLFGVGIMLLQSEKGQGLVEYALIIALIALAIILALRLFGVTIQDLYQDVVDSFAGL